MSWIERIARNAYEASLAHGGKPIKETRQCPTATATGKPTKSSRTQGRPQQGVIGAAKGTLRARPQGASLVKIVVIIVFVMPPAEDAGIISVEVTYLIFLVFLWVQLYLGYSLHDFGPEGL